LTDVLCEPRTRSCCQDVHVSCRSMGIVFGAALKTPGTQGSALRADKLPWLSSRRTRESTLSSNGDLHFYSKPQVSRAGGCALHRHMGLVSPQLGILLGPESRNPVPRLDFGCCRQTREVAAFLKANYGVGHDRSDRISRGTRYHTSRLTLQQQVRPRVHDHTMHDGCVRVSSRVRHGRLHGAWLVAR
jgi:hypothetical protein